MSRATNGFVSKLRHKKITNLAKGYRGRAKNCYRLSLQKVEKSLLYSSRDRLSNKRSFRLLWIQRINASVRRKNLVYSQFLKGIKLLNINLNRKILSEIMIIFPDFFSKIIDKIKASI